MVVYDGIIETLQSYGGISVLFKELLARSQEYSYLSYKEGGSHISQNEQFNSIISARNFERYRDVDLSMNDGIFHSTYYRLPVDKSVNIVTTVHDFTYEMFVKGLPRKVHSWQKNRAIINSDKVICVSNNTALDLLKYCSIDERKISVINNGVSNDYKPLGEITTHSNQVVFIGARGGYKNFFSAVDTIALTSELALSIVGGGALKKEEVQYLEYRIPGRYKWMGMLSNAELNLLYNEAYCLLYPSSYEGFGIPVIEAMKAGCPIVALNSSSIPEVVGDDSILVSSPDPQLLLEALLALNNSIERNKWITIGLANSKRFSWERCYRETNQLYSGLI